MTVAERALDPAQCPDADPGLLVPGSLVFQRSRRPVDLRDYRNWWRYVPGACRHRPEGPGSDTYTRGRHPVVHVAYQDAEAYARWWARRLVVAHGKAGSQRKARSDRNTLQRRSGITPAGVRRAVAAGSRDRFGGRSRRVDLQPVTPALDDQQKRHSAGPVASRCIGTTSARASPRSEGARRTGTVATRHRNSARRACAERSLPAAKRRDLARVPAIQQRAAHHRTPGRRVAVEREFGPGRTSRRPSPLPVGGLERGTPMRSRCRAITTAATASIASRTRVPSGITSTSRRRMSQAMACATLRAWSSQAANAVAVIASMGCQGAVKQTQRSDPLDAHDLGALARRAAAPVGEQLEGADAHELGEASGRRARPARQGAPGPGRSRGRGRLQPRRGRPRATVRARRRTDLRMDSRSGDLAFSSHGVRYLAPDHRQIGRRGRAACRVLCAWPRQLDISLMKKSAGRNWPCDRSCASRARCASTAPASSPPSSSASPTAGSKDSTPRSA